MNIIHMSDLHGSLPQIPKKYKWNPNVIIFLSGDICPNNVDNFVPGIKSGPVFNPTSWNGFWNFRKIDIDAERLYQNIWIETKLIPHLEKNGIKLDQIIGVSGNHDWAIFSNYFPNIIEAESKTITIQDIKIGLLCGSLWFTGEWQDEVTEQILLDRINNIETDIDILISHQPPYSILDRGHGEARIGSQSIYTSIFGKSVFDNIQPRFNNLRLHCFGHAHDAKGAKHFNIEDRKIKFYNAANTRFDIEFNKTGE